MANKFNAFIPAAGLGTRLLPLTSHTPKALVKIGGKPLLEHLILKLKANNVEEIVINVHHFAEQIITFLQTNDNFGLKIIISDEQKELLNTGGGLKKALSLFSNSNPILVHNVDIFSDLSIHEILNYHNANNALATLVVKNRITNRYLLFDSHNKLCGWKNIKTNEIKMSRKSPQTRNLAFSGLHVVSTKLLDTIIENGAFSVIDMYLRLAKNKNIIALEDNSSTWFDIGKYEQINEAEKLFI